MKKLLIYIIALTIHIPISWSSDSEEELPMDISEYANSFLTSSLADILGNEQPNNSAKMNNDTFELFSYPYEKEYLQPKSPPFAKFSDDISHQFHDKYNFGFEDPILGKRTPPSSNNTNAKNTSIALPGLIDSFLSNIPPNAVFDFTEEAWEEKAKELNINWASSMYVFIRALNILKKNQNSDPLLTLQIQKLANAALRIHDNAKAPKKNFFTEVQKLAANIDPARLSDFSNEDWEKKVRELKESCPYKEKKSFLELYNALHEFSENKKCDQALFPHLQNLAKAARRIHENRKTPKKNLSTEVQKLVANIDPARLSDFSDEDWEEKAEELKKNYPSMKEISFYGLYTALYKLSKNQNFDQALFPHLQNLAKAAQRIYKRKNKLNPSEPNPVSTKTNKNTAFILDKYIEYRPKNNPAPKKSKYASSERDGPLIENLTFDQNQTEISSFLEDSSEFLNSFLTSSLTDILGNQSPNNNAKMNNDTLDLFTYPYEKEYLQPKSPPFAGVFDDISHHFHDKYNLGFEDPILSHTNEEINFFDLNKEETNIQISLKNTCATFKECLLSGFSNYLTLKKKLLYIHKFMPSDFRELKNEVKFHEKGFYPQEDIEWHDYFLNFIYNKIIFPCQNNNLNLEKYNPARPTHRNALLRELRKSHPCALQICNLLAECPPTLFLANEDQLRRLHPNFYKDFQIINQIKTNAASNQQIRQNTNDNNVSILGNRMPQSYDNTNAKNVSVILPGLNNNFLDNIPPNAASDFTAETPADYNQQIVNKNLPTFNVQEGCIEMDNLLDNSSVKDFPPTENALIYKISDEASLGESYENTHKKPASVNKHSKFKISPTTLLPLVENFLRNIDPAKLPNLSEEDWKEKATELKESLHCSNGSLFLVLYKISKTQKFDKALLPYLKALYNAARRFTYNEEASISKLSPKIQELLKKVQELTEAVDPTTLLNFKDKDWKEKATELKNKCSLMKNSNFAVFEKALNKLMKNQHCDQALLPYLKALSNAANRLCGNKKIPKIQDLLQKVQELIKALDPATLQSFNNEDWEKKATDLKMNCAYTFYGLYRDLNRLNKNQNWDPLLTPLFQNLAKAALRIHDNGKAPKYSLSTEVQKLVENIDPARLPDFSDKDWEEKAEELKKNYPCQKENTAEILCNALNTLKKNQNGDSSLLPYFHNLANAALRIHKKKSKLNLTESNQIATKTNKNNTSLSNAANKLYDNEKAQKIEDLLQKVKKLTEAADPTTLHSFKDKYWEEKATELTMNGTWTFYGLYRDLNKLNKNQNWHPLLTPHFQNLAKAALRIHDNEINPNGKAPQYNFSTEVQKLAANIDPARLPDFSDKDWEEKVEELKKNYPSQKENNFNGLYRALHELIKNQNYDPSLLPHLHNLANAARRIHERKNKLNTTESNPVSTIINDKNTLILGKRIEYHPKNNPAPKKLKDASLEKDTPLAENLTFNQNQTEISLFLEAFADYNQQTVNLESTAPLNHSPTEIKNTNEQDILDKIKNYVRPASFEADSALHQLIEKKDFFDIIQKQIFALFDYPPIFTMLTDVLMNDSFSNETKRSAFNIISDFVLLLRQNKKATNFIDEEAFALIADIASEQDWKEDQWIDFAEIYATNPEVVDFIEPKTDLVLQK
ncbi:MAG: hypothetical protein Q8S31_06365 [Alphaproteobacteria bacterium]|nr:hypothetical protein [Alphaproteobacteria bacterium]